MCIEDGSMKPPQEQEEGMPTLELVLLLWTTLASEECCNWDAECCSSECEEQRYPAARKGRDDAQPMMEGSLFKMQFLNRTLHQLASRTKRNV